MKQTTPMMQQYYKLKAMHQDKFLFFRLGDFYELFGDDAKSASKILSILLTKRNGIEMCGIPHHQFNNYAHKIIRQGKKIAIAEQVGNIAEKEKIIERKITKIISPGMVLDDNLLPETNNYLLILAAVNLTVEQEYGLLMIDISTGEVIELKIKVKSSLQFLDEIKNILYHYAPKEIIIEKNKEENNSSKKETALPQQVEFFPQQIKNLFPNLVVSPIKSTSFNKFSEIEIKKVLNKIFFSGELPNSNYLEGHYRLLAKFVLENGFADSLYLKKPVIFKKNDYLTLEYTTLKQLEIVENQFDELKEFTLFKTMDYTQTLMGKRWLKRNLLKPLKNFSSLEKRINKVTLLKKNVSFLNKIREKLRSIHDLERIVINLQNGSLPPKSLLKLAYSLEKSINIMKEVAELTGGEWELIDLNQGINNLGKINEIYLQIKNSILPETNNHLKEGGVINPQWDSELSELYAFKKNSLNLLNQLERKAQRLTGVVSLKVKYNSNQRFFFEVSKLHSNKIGSGFIRKQTLTNSVRFVNSELLELDNTLFNLKEKILLREKELYQAILNSLKNEISLIIQVNDFITELDFYCSLAFLANKHNYHKPTFNQKGILSIKNARHPMVEKSLPRGQFIPNSLIMNRSTHFHLITGPNMAGKSTFLRQNALLIIMAQVGSYVAAEAALLPIFDKIFTRIGSGDKLSKGESTFMVEMKEVGEIIKKTSDDSFVIMDEIGRGTGTYDGYALAESIIEYFLKYKKTKTLFATHYQELGKLANRYKAMANYNVLVKESEGKIIFLKKLVEGVTSKSYGVYVAQLAGLPQDLVDGAKKKLVEMEKNSFINKNDERKKSSNNTTDDVSNLANKENYPELYDYEKLQREKIYQKLKEIDLNRITPLEALNLLSQLKKDLPSV